MGLSWLSAKTLKNHERMELSWANNVYNTEFSVEIRLEHGFATFLGHICSDKVRYKHFNETQLFSYFLWK